MMRMGAFPLILVSAMLGMLSGPPSASGQPADPETKIPVFLSTDVGNEMDDQWAVVYTLLSPEFDVLGVASAYAPSIPAPAGFVGYQLLLDIVENRLDLKTHPPLVEGASQPLPDSTTPRRSQAALSIIESSRPFSPRNRLNVMAIGR